LFSPALRIVKAEQLKYFILYHSAIPIVKMIWIPGSGNRYTISKRLVEDHFLKTKSPQGEFCGLSNMSPFISHGNGPSLNGWAILVMQRLLAANTFTGTQGF
jgi:hypothetical protein